MAHTKIGYQTNGALLFKFKNSKIVRTALIFRKIKWILMRMLDEFIGTFGTERLEA